MNELSSLKDDVLDGLEDSGYNGPLLDCTLLDKALEVETVSVQYSQLVAWLTDKLRAFTKLEEQVNAITGPDDFPSFMLELSGFLREYGCPHPCLTEGPLNKRLASHKAKLILLDYLLSELYAVKMLAVKKPQVLHTSGDVPVQKCESELARHLKEAVIAVGLPRPPRITATKFFENFIPQVVKILAKSAPDQLGKPLLKCRLSEKQWSHVLAMNEAMAAEYCVRREMLLKRLDVTIQSFRWSGKAQRNKDELAAVYQPIRNSLKAKTDVSVKDILAARDDLLRLEKTSGGSHRDATKCQINRVLMGMVPDRGGRTGELEPPPPEMPSFQQRQGAPARGDLVKKKTQAELVERRRDSV